MHGKTMREALNEVRSFRDATNEGGPGSGPQKSYKTIPKNETESEKDIRLDKATAVSKAANDKRISDAIKQFQKQDEKQKKKSGELKFRKYDTNEGGPGSGPQKGGKKQTSANIKKAYGILNDPRYKQGNYSGAAKAIDKLSPGLSNHPDVKNAMKRANEELDETMVVTKVDKDTNSPAYQKFKAGDKRYVYKEEVELSEKKANYIDIKLNSTNDLKRMMTWLDKNISPVNNELYDNAAQEGQSIIQFEDVPNVDKLMQKLKSARINFKVDTMESLDLPATGDTTTSNASQEEETVELDEAAFSQAQIDSLKKAYGDFSSTGVSMKNMDKLKATMKRYSKNHLSQLAKLDIPMVSKTAKELL